MKWRVFACSTFICLIGIALLIPCNDIANGIGMSIIAAYIFYFPIEFIPSIMRDWNNLTAKMVAYRKLYLLLIRLDSIFIPAYQISKNDKSLAPENDMKIDEFYNPLFMKSFMNGFDLKQDSPVHNLHTQKPISYAGYFIGQWNDVIEYAKQLITLPCVQEDVELAFQVDFLISDNSLAHIKKTRDIGFDISCIDFECFLSLNQIGEDSQIRSFDNIVKLHKTAHKYYNRLKKDKRFASFLNAPHFIG